MYAKILGARYAYKKSQRLLSGAILTSSTKHSIAFLHLPLLLSALHVLHRIKSVYR